MAAFFIGIPVFLAIFFAAALPAAVYGNSFFPTIGILFSFVGCACILAREHYLNIFHVLTVNLGDEFLYQSVLLALRGVRADVL